MYASASRLVLETPKTRVAKPLRYAGFLEHTIKSKLLFERMRFEPLLDSNANILFVDRVNVVSVPAPE